MKSSLRLATLALLSAVFLAACSDDSTGPSATIDGTYTLHTANGQTLPAVMWSDVWNGVTYSDLITAGTLTLSNGIFSGTIGYEWWEDGQVEWSGTDSFGGEYTRSGSAVTYHFGDFTATGTFSGNTLTLIIDEGDGDVWTLSYRR